MIQQRAQLGDRNRHVGFQGIGTEKIVKQATDRALLKGGTGHMAGGTEGVFPFMHVVEQCLG